MLNMREENAILKRSFEVVSESSFIAFYPF